MAVKFQEVDDKLRKTPLSQQELSQVDSVEKYIDEKIRAQYKGSPVHIELQIVDFQYDPVAKKSQYDHLPYARRKMMREELERRYKEAGWKIEVEIDDGLDGPNMSGPDYWKLSGDKNQIESVAKVKCNHCGGKGEVRVFNPPGWDRCPYCYK
jgi:hypothetical protein